MTKLFDLHCDTPYRMFREKLELCDTRLDVNSRSFSDFDGFTQISAVWSDSKRTGEQNYSDFFEIAENYFSQIKKYGIILCKNRNDLHLSCPKTILSVEGGELLCGKLSRLSVLYTNGVRILTPLWRGESDIGGGYDTEKGLTLFGRALVSECERLGVVIDTSHMSERAFWDTLELTEKPFIVSHSNSKSICPHPRNITDDQLRAVLKRGGIVGINFYPPHLAESFNEQTPDRYINAICRHIMHFLDIGGEKTLALGADRDGFDRVDGYSGTEYVTRLYDALLKERINQKTIDDIFFGNAEHFFENALPLR